MHRLYDESGTDMHVQMLPPYAGKTGLCVSTGGPDAAAGPERRIAFLGELLTQVRLFSSETEMSFQIEVAKVLLHIDTHQARLHVYKVMKGWTVPKRVKTEIEAAISRAKKANGGDE